MIAAHHQRSTCGSENVGRSLIKSGIEHQPSMILTATWCLRTWEQAKLMIMQHGMRCTHVCEQSAHFARACGVRMWHTAAEHTEIQRTIPMSHYVKCQEANLAGLVWLTMLSEPGTSGVCQVRREHGYSAATMLAVDGADGVDSMAKCDLLST